LQSLEEARLNPRRGLSHPVPRLDQPTSPGIAAVAGASSGCNRSVPEPVVWKTACPQARLGAARPCPATEHPFDASERREASRRWAPAAFRESAAVNSRACDEIPDGHRSHPPATSRTMSPAASRAPRSCTRSPTGAVPRSCHPASRRATTATWINSPCAAVQTRARWLLAAHRRPRPPRVKSRSPPGSRRPSRARVRLPTGHRRRHGPGVTQALVGEFCSAATVGRVTSVRGVALRRRPPAAPGAPPSGRRAATRPSGRVTTTRTSDVARNLLRGGGDRCRRGDCATAPPAGSALLQPPRQGPAYDRHDRS
jgi:hypothetical protein